MHGAEPGTGTQYATIASPPNSDDDKPCTHRVNGRMWKVGHDYIDSEIGDVCKLVAVVGKSTWCDTRSPEECPAKLVFAYDRYEGIDGNTIEVDPQSLNFDEERFIERYEADLPRSAPSRPW